MGTEALLRPQSVGAASGSAVLASGSAIGTTDTLGTSSSDEKLYMKVQTVQISAGVKIQDTTGDGDLVAHFDHNAEIRGKVTLRGFMLADHHIGIENLTNTGDSVNPFLVKLQLGVGSGSGGGSSTTRVYKFKLMVSNIVVDWNRVAGLVGVAISGELTDTYSGSGSIILDED
tara:strand:- start:6667 stop:7185 length:519 start_codon:yes stop_codon:yes gene_type:complete